MEIFQFDLLKSNKDNFFDLACGTLHLTISLRLNNPKIQTDETDYFTKVDKEFENFEDPLYLKLASSLGIKKGDYYKDELLNSSTDQATFEQAMKSFYSSNSVRVPSDTAFLHDDLLSKSTPLAYPEHANLFELFVRVIIFSPLTNYTRLTQLYTLLLKLDQTGSEKRVKRSHAEFLIWYILRLSLVPVSLSDVSAKCNKILHVSETSVVSAFISSGTKKYDCTNILSLWLVAQKKQQSNCVLTLGQNGRLDNLQKALQFWATNDSDAKDFTAEKENTLKVVANCVGGSKVFEYTFNSDYKILIDQKVASINGIHALVLQNSEEALNFEDFSHLLSRFDMLDWVLSKLSSCASDALQLKISREPPGKGSSKDLKVNIRVKLDSEEIGVATFVPLNPKRKIDSVEKSLASYIFQNESHLTFNKINVPSRQVESMTGSVTLRSLLNEALDELRCEVLHKFDQSKSSLGYKRSTLALFYISLSSSKVVLNNKLLSGSNLDLDLDTLIRTNSLSSSFSVTLECVETEQRRYSSYAKDVRLSEGIEDLEFPFSPCHIVSQDQNYAQVIFKGETGKVSLTEGTRKIKMSDVIV